MPTLDVIFRKDREDGSIVAVFPSEPGTGPHDFIVYAHLGQHATGTPEWYNRHTRPATPPEYAALLVELNKIYDRPMFDGVTLRPVKRMTAAHRAARKEACR